MKDERDWRKSNAPLWVKEAVENELEQYKLTAALSWPTEPKPAPVSFRWGDYGQLFGTPIPGVYYRLRSGPVEIAENKDGGFSWKSWMFREEGRDWSTSVPRCPLFTSERDARLYRLWEECETAARNLMILRDAIR